MQARRNPCELLDMAQTLKRKEKKGRIDPPRLWSPTSHPGHPQNWPHQVHATRSDRLLCSRRLSPSFCSQSPPPSPPSTLCLSACASAPGLVGLSLSYALSLTGLLSGLVSSFTKTEAMLVSVERLEEYSCGLPQEPQGRPLQVGPRPLRLPPAGPVASLPPPQHLRHARQPLPFLLVPFTSTSPLSSCPPPLLSPCLIGSLSLRASWALAG